MKNQETEFLSSMCQTLSEFMDHPGFVPIWGPLKTLGEWAHAWELCLSTSLVNSCVFLDLSLFVTSSGNVPWFGSMCKTFLLLTHSHMTTCLWLAFNSFVIIYCLIMSNLLDIVNSIKTGIVFLSLSLFSFVFLMPHGVPSTK